MSASPLPGPAPQAPQAGSRAETHRAAFGALAQTCDVDWTQLTSSQRGRFNRAAKEISGVVGNYPDLVVAEILRRGQIYRQRYQVEITPTAIAANWANLDPSRQQATTGRADQGHQQADRMRQAAQRLREQGL